MTYTSTHVVVISNTHVVTVTNPGTTFGITSPAAGRPHPSIGPRTSTETQGSTPNLPTTVTNPSSGNSPIPTKAHTASNLRTSSSIPTSDSQPSSNSNFSPISSTFSTSSIISIFSTSPISSITPITSIPPVSARSSLTIWEHLRHSRLTTISDGQSLHNDTRTFSVSFLSSLSSGGTTITPPQNSSSGGSSLATPPHKAGAVIGGVLGGVAALAILSIFSYWWLRRWFMYRTRPVQFLPAQDVRANANADTSVQPNVTLFVEMRNSEAQPPPYSLFAPTQPLRLYVSSFLNHVSLWLPHPARIKHLHFL